MPKRALTDAQVLSIPELILGGLTWKQAAARLGVTNGTISGILCDGTYAELQPQIQKRMREVSALLAKKPAVRTCTRCVRAFPNTEEFFPPLTRRGKRVLEARCRGCKKRQNKLRYINSKLRVMRHYSGGDPKCSCCGETAYEFLSIDHIDGGGREHRAEIKKGKGGVCSIHLWLEANDFPDGFRVLCLNCNGAIGFFGYCPHQGRPDDSLIPD